MPQNQGQQPVPRNPWEELAGQANRSSNTRRSNSAQRDRAVLSAIRAGSSARELANLLDVSVQAIYQAAERAEAEQGVEGGSHYAEILARLASLTGAVKFEEMANLLLGQFIPDLRPTQRSGDRGRDAVAGDNRHSVGEELVVTVSLAKDWSRKVGADMKRLADRKLAPRRVYAVTNRLTDERRLQRLEREAATYGWGLTVFDARWLATQLAQPQHADLCRDHLGLAAPKPGLFLDVEEYSHLLAAAASSTQVPFVGREDEIAHLAKTLRDARTIILEAPGGLGKSRLLAEAARRDEERRWLFVREGMPFAPETLAETGAGEVVVVVDDAHRREDRRALLSTLERRVPRPLIVLVCRPGFKEEIARDLEGLAFGPAEDRSLPPLARPELAKMLEEPPLEIRFGGLRAAIVELSEGNPQIALIAAELSQQGLAVHELRGSEVIRAYAGAVLREAGAGGRERIALMALVAAVGRLNLLDADAELAAELLGLPLPHLRREVADLADRGMLLEREGLVSIKPDLLAEHVLIGCFFDRNWAPALDYADVYRRFAPRRRMEMLAILGQAFKSAPESARASSPQLDDVRRDLLGSSSGTWSVEQTAEALAAVAPGLSALALEGFDRLLADLNEDGESSPGLWQPLLEIPARVPEFPEGWRRMLTLTRRLFAAHNFEDPIVDSQWRGDDEWMTALKAFCEAFGSVHKRLPVDLSPGDGKVLAGVQEAMAQLTPAWWKDECSRPGAPETALVAARTLVTTIFEIHRADAANAMQINMISIGVPASEFTKRCLAAGLGLLLEAMPQLSLKGQLRAVETLRGLAHPALGFAGPFGLELSKETQAMINELLEETASPWLAHNLPRLPLPVATAVLELVEWRTHFGQPSPTQFEVPEELRDYRELIEPGQNWSREEPRRDRRNRLRAIAGRHAQLLAADPTPERQLERWRSWYELRLTTGGQAPNQETLGMLLERVVEIDSARGIEVLELLLETDSPLLAHAAVAMGAALNREPQRAGGWLESSPVSGRVALAWAAAELREEGLQRRLMEVLAHDSEAPVREATARALRYRTGLSGWRVDLVLDLALEDGGTWLLSDLLQDLTEQDESATLDLDQLQRIETVLLKTADQPSRRDDSLVPEAVEAMRKLGRDLVWSWIWRRLDRLKAEGGRSALLEAIPGSMVALIPAEGDGEKLAKVLDRLEQEPPSNWRAEDSLLKLALALDDGVLQNRLQRWVESGSGRAYVHRVLSSPMSWERFESYAAAVLAADASPESIAMVVQAREPTSFMGSRVPSYEAAREGFAAWMKHSDGYLVRAAIFAQQYYDERITQARKEEIQRLNHYGS